MPKQHVAHWSVLSRFLWHALLRCVESTCPPHAMHESLLVKVEVWDGCRVATRVIAIGVVGEQRMLCGAAVHGVGGGVDTLHLVEHHSLE